MTSGYYSWPLRDGSIVTVQAHDAYRRYEHFAVRVISSDGYSEIFFDGLPDNARTATEEEVQRYQRRRDRSPNPNLPAID